MPSSSTAPTPEALASWLTERLAAHAQLTVEEIQPDVPMASYGLDSVTTVSMLVEIEDELGLTLDPNVPWEYPTIEALTAHLAEEARRLHDSGQAARPEAQGG